MIGSLYVSLCRPAIQLVASMAAAVLFSMASPAWCATLEDQSRPSAGGPPTPVQVHLFVGDVFRVAGADQTFEADVVLGAEWQDARLEGRWPGPHTVSLADVWHPRLMLINGRDVSTILPETAEVHPSGHVRYLQRWRGRFSAPMDLRDFPLDHQRFKVHVISLGYPRDQVDLVPYALPGVPNRAEQLSVTDWSMGPATLQPADFTLSPGVKTFAGVSLTWEGARRFRYYAAQVFLPLVTIIFMGWTALLLDHSDASIRISVSTTTMLTLIAYRFALGTEVPHLAYLTRFDYFMVGSTILVFLILMFVATGAYLVKAGKTELVYRVDRRMRAAFPLAFLVMTLLVWKW